MTTELTDKQQELQEKNPGSIYRIMCIDGFIRDYRNGKQVPYNQLRLNRISAIRVTLNPTTKQRW